MSRLRRTAVVVSAVLMVSGCGVMASPAGPEIVYVGVDLPLTGPGAVLGEAFHNALLLRVEQANARDLVGERRRLELRVRDNRSTDAIATDNLAAFAADPEVAAVVTAGCPECVAAGAAPPVPTISLDAVDVLATAAEPEYVFRLGPNAGDNADRLSQQMAESGVETVSLLAVDDAYGQAGVQEMTDAAERDGISIITVGRVGSGEEDGVAAAVAEVTAWQPEEAALIPAPGVPPGPDAVVIWAPAPRSAGLATGLRRAGYDGPLYLEMMAADNLFLTGDAVAFAGATMVLFDTPVIDQLIAASPAAAARASWASDYLSRYGTYHLQASWAADAVNVLAQAIKRVGAADRALIRDVLEDTRLDGFTGLVRFTANQHSGLHPTSLSLLTAAGGRWYPQAG